MWSSFLNYLPRLVAYLCVLMSWLDAVTGQWHSYTEGSV